LFNIIKTLKMDFANFNHMTNSTFELAMEYTKQAIDEKRYTHPRIIHLNEGHKNTILIDGFVFKLYIYKDIVRPTRFIDNLLKIKNDDDFMFHLSKHITDLQNEEIIYETCYINDLNYKFYYIHNNGELVFINTFNNYIMFIRPFIPGCTLDMYICCQDEVYNYDLSKRCCFSEYEYETIKQANMYITGSRQLKYLHLTKNIIVNSLIEKYKSMTNNTNIRLSNIIINENGITFVDQYHLIFYTTFYHDDATNNNNLKIQFIDSMYYGKGYFNRNSKAYGMATVLTSLIVEPRNSKAGFIRAINSFRSDDEELNKVAQNIYQILNWQTEAPYPDFK